MWLFNVQTESKQKASGHYLSFVETSKNLILLSIRCFVLCWPTIFYCYLFSRLSLCRFFSHSLDSSASLGMPHSGDVDRCCDGSQPKPVALDSIKMHTFLSLFRTATEPWLVGFASHLVELWKTDAVESNVRPLFGNWQFLNMLAVHRTKRNGPEQRRTAELTHTQYKQYTHSHTADDQKLNITYHL